MLIICLTIVAWIGSVQAQETKTIKLLNSEDVLDISGEWDAQIENYGPWSEYGTYKYIIKITQEGTSFVGIRLTSPVKEAFRGELDTDGIKKVQLLTGMGPLEAKGQISEDGNKIILDDREKARSILTRK